MTIQADIQALSPGSIIEVYILDLSVINSAGGVLRFHAGTNKLENELVWQGYTYMAYPIKAKGFEYVASGQAPRPQISVAPGEGLVPALNKAFDDLVGARFYRKRTFVKYLDAVNFPGNVNPTADPLVEFPIDIYYVERKINENKNSIDYELVSSFDLDGIKLPGRVILSNTCPWQYRIYDEETGTFKYAGASECGYTGSLYFDFYDQAVTEMKKDVCGKRLTSCKARFGETAELSYGGFPGAGRLLR